MYLRIGPTALSEPRMQFFVSTNLPWRAALLVSALALLMAAFSGPAQADFFDCKDFDDASLCKQLNRYPMVKDLPVITAWRIQELYHTKPGYARDLLEDRPIVIEGTVASTEEKDGRVSVTLNEDANPAEAVVLQLFSTHPLAGKDGRMASRSSREVQAILREGRLGVFKNCVFWH
jgi:hypothetical protein